jgi:hypothetical protein|tara:strand:- start:74 stop:1501 length:1428 start_codon:yes stop_codon:yes gene_type:complete
MTTIIQTDSIPEPQDSILALASKSEEAEDNHGFDKVLEQTAHEEDREGNDEKNSEENAASAERKQVTNRASSNQQGHNQSAVKSGKLSPVKLINFDQINGKGGEPVNITKMKGALKEAKGTLKEQIKSPEQQNSAKVKSQTQARQNDQAKSIISDKILDGHKTLKALKQEQVRQAAKTEVRKKLRQKSKLEDKAKSTELRARNAPTKISVNNFLNTAKTTVQVQNSTAREGETANGMQVAVNSGKMVMQIKQSDLNEAVRPALVEELRPATSAEVSSQAGSQQQDLPREEAKENTLPPAPVMPVATPAATGTGAVQAFTPSAGVITPMMEKVWNAVSAFRARGGDELVVKVQPDSKTQVQLTIKYGNAGVEIQARMQQGDGQQLTSGWSELQQALADRGVSLSDLVRESSTESNFEQNSKYFDKNSQNKTQNEELNIGDDQGDWSALGLRSKEENKGQTRREKVLPAHDGWQSWA